MHPTVFPLENPVQNYAWGSRTAIADFLGRPSPEGRPEAELWIGAHPSAPSRMAGAGASERLDALIASAPESLLGADVARRFRGELPFLLKVLAVGEPLSIQCHPNQVQARAGFERENQAGIPLTAFERNYRDGHHKPELVAALSRFVVLKGFRPIGEMLQLLRPLELGDIQTIIAALQHQDDLRHFFSALLSLDPETKRRTMTRAAEAAARIQQENPAYAWVVRLHDKYPGDAGVLSPLLLNLVELQPEEALFLPAGELHAYLDGVALEIMANSDNVLRGGLTPKHIDVGELLAIAHFKPGSADVLRPERVSARERVYRTAAAEFELGLIRVASSAPYWSPAGRGVEMLLGLEGDATLVAGRSSLSLEKGRSAFVPAEVASYRIEGSGRVCRAGVAPV